MLLMSHAYDTDLQEMIAQMERLEVEQAEEIQRLKERDSAVERRRRELYELVSRDNNDLENRQLLERADEELSQLRNDLMRLERGFKDEVRELREQVLRLRNRQLERLEKECRELRVREEAVRNDLLPEALQHVELLREEEEALRKRSKELTNRIDDLSRMDLGNNERGNQVA